MAAVRMPVMFVGHGSPMNAIEDNEFSRSWIEEGRKLPRPRAVLCISAHWRTEGLKIVTERTPRTIHDFYGFPRELYEVSYPAPGLPDLAEEVAVCARRAFPGAEVVPDLEWGIDHGAWSVLRRLFPDADVPVVQLGLDRSIDGRGHFELAVSLRPLRRRGVLILGSGNVVHNLGTVRFEDAAYDWALSFDRTVADLVDEGDFDSLVDYRSLGGDASLAVPTDEHYLPFLYELGLKEEDEKLRAFADRVTLGSISMRSYVTEDRSASFGGDAVSGSQ